MTDPPLAHAIDLTLFSSLCKSHKAEIPKHARPESEIDEKGAYGHLVCVESEDLGCYFWRWGEECKSPYHPSSKARMSVGR